MLQGLECRVNLIRYNQLPQSEWRGSPKRTIEKFQQQLKNSGVLTTIRASRGEDIMAACGMLSTKEKSTN
jgi:23S rRNA (adenine2503-C2)-methyltransferase